MGYAGIAGWNQRQEKNDILVSQRCEPDKNVSLEKNHVCKKPMNFRAQRLNFDTLV